MATAIDATNALHYSQSAEQKSVPTVTKAGNAHDPSKSTLILNRLLTVTPIARSIPVKVACRSKNILEISILKRNQI